MKTLFAILLLATAAGAQMPADCPMHQQHMKAQQHAGLQHRGDEGMGFSQSATTHHFLLREDGGVIQVEANDAQDTASRDQIRQHLQHIAGAFAKGDFDIPMFVHDRQDVPGVKVMQQKKDAIAYRYETTDQGGQVVISTSDATARTAVRDFLVFQIKEHETGDPVK